MKIVAKYAVQLGGHVFRKGEATEYDGEVTPRIAANFTRADGQPLSTDAKRKNGGQAAAGAAEAKEAKEDAEEKMVANTIRSLKKDGIMRKLDSMGVTYPADATVEFLARLYLMSQGEIKA